MPAASSATPDHIRDVNERYHDVAAADYDLKWGIDFGDIGRGQTRLKLTKALGDWPGAPFEHALEIGSGTGYFSLNLMQQGMIERLTATDISGGMLRTLMTTADRLGLAERVEATQTDAETLPFDDESFDLVLGHAILHHIPDLEQAFREFARVLRPGGRIVFCGEPSRYGDRLAAVPKRVGVWTAPVWRRAIGAEARNGHAPLPDFGHGVDRGSHEHDHAFHGEDAHDLESEVDVHAFIPGDLQNSIEAAGFADVRVKGEELLANFYGWWLRSLEASTTLDQIPVGWRTFAFRSYIALQRLDTSLLEPRLPASLFYNLVLSARKPG